MKEVFIALKRIFWLNQYIGKKNKVLFAIAFFAVVVTSIITAYIPQAIGTIVDKFNKSSFPYSSLIAIGSLYLFSEIFTYLRKYCVESAATDSWKKLTCLNIDHFLHIDLLWLKNQELGGLNARFQRSITGAIKLLKISFMDLFPAFLMMVFSIAVSVHNSLIVGGITSLVIPIAFYMIIRQIKSQQGIRISLNRAIETIQAKLIEVLTGIDTIRAAGDEAVQLNKLGNYSEDIRSKEFRHHKAMMSFDAIKGVNKAFWNIVVLAVALYFFKIGQITVGQIFTFLLLFGNVIRPLDEFHRFLDEASEASILTGDFKEIMEISKDKVFDNSDKTSFINHDTNTLVEAADFSFGYNGHAVISNIAFKINQGKFYGIVGESGCGKSTLIKNILGFNYGQGTLKYRDIDIRILNREVLTNRIAVVPQNPFVITASFRENIVLGLKGSFSDEEIWDAAKKAKIDQLIRGSENGLDSIVSPSGNNISGGEKQRIALARIFLHPSAELIILDEGTSALDNVTEQQIYNNLFELTKMNKSIISIAHRLDTLRNADEILVMDKGIISETGTFDQLQGKNGIFSKLLFREKTNNTVQGNTLEQTKPSL
jgi:ABC-type multidrug transport system fused ATPase/permease subunit